MAELQALESKHANDTPHWHKLELLALSGGLWIRGGAGGVATYNVSRPGCIAELSTVRTTPSG